MDKIRVVTGVIGAGKGGMSRFAVNLFKYLDPERFDVTFLANVPKPYFGPEIAERGGHIKVIASRSRHPLRHKAELKRIMEEGRFDVCHIHLSTASNIAPLIAAKKAGVPLILAHSHSSNVEGGSLVRFLHQKNAPKLQKYTDKRLACSKPAGEFMFPGMDFTVVKNAVDLDRFVYSPETRERLRRELGLEDAFVLGHIGRMAAPKNPLFLIKVFAQAAKLSPKARLLYVGDGPMEESIRQAAGELGVLDKIIFAGAVENPQDYLCAMDCFLLPSLFEGFPLTVVEASASGLPVFAADTVTSEIEGLPGVTRFSLGIGPEKIAQTVLMNGKAKTRESQTRALTAAGFSWEGNVRKIEQIYLGEAANQ